jgi:hypothetical protein
MGTRDWLLLMLLPEPESPDMSRTSLLDLRSRRTSSLKSSKVKLNKNIINLFPPLKIICASPDARLSMGLLRSAAVLRYFLKALIQKR